MHPSPSIIFFTVTAGAGYGFLFWLAFARLGGLAPDISNAQLITAAVIGLFLVTAGLLSSTLHLANPKNAWRSFMRFRTSWLSREAVFAVLFYPVTLLWMLTGGSTVLGLLVAALALVVLFCTAMIYGSLKTIRQWHNALTPVNFLLLGLAAGAVLFTLVTLVQGVFTPRLLAMTVATMAAAAFAKLIYFSWIGQPAGPTINTALGFTRATVQLLDVGHSSDTFLTKEFGYQVARVKIIWARIASILLGFVLPLMLLTGLLGTVGVGYAVVATILVMGGVFVERWLFFAEARHVVTLYHGQQST
jgi:sulfite dehydrogenase (quinone) subunit SoeC